MWRMKNLNAVALGTLGGEARAQSTTPEQRRAWARLGGIARASQHSEKELSNWGKLGGRPRKETKGGKR
jgi:hypothetical protein